MLSRGRAFAGEVGSSKAVCAVNRAPPSFIELKGFEHQRLVGRICGNQYHWCLGF